ncbi:hypothetical protein C5708_03850 [Caulobacter sp. CCUG 60055]|nr:hypothetical protein [Caulobacter sp. CCUG 60055]
MAAAALAGVAASALGAAPAAAQEQAPAARPAEPAGVEEIVVSARRRDERLQDVPAAVTAFSSDTLRNLQAGSIGDIESATPNLTIHVGDASNAVIYMRGVGQIDSLAFADPGVGVYVDDVYLGRAQGAFLDVYDVDRIEVLRGPQGTLYGRNTIGGAVKFVSKPLTDAFGGEAEATVGDYGLFQAKASVNAPLVGDRLIAKAAVARIGLVTGSLNDQTNVSYAVYGQGAYKLTDRLSLTAGLRYTYENKDFSRSQKYFAATTPFPVPYGAPGLLATDISTSHDWASWSPKLGLDFHWTPDVLAYASVSRGFKSGGFDGRANDAAGAKPYNPETLWAYEVGIKSTLFERRLTANAALFWNDYRDLQLSSFVADAHGGFAALFTNAGQATMRGAELELVARPVRGLTLNLVTGYLDGRYDRYIGPGGVDISRQRKLVNAPRWDVKLGGTYRFDLGERGAITVGADAGYRSKTYPTVSSSEVLAQKGYTLVNAFARYDSPGAKWWLQVGGKNLTDRRYINQGFDLSDSLGYQLAYYGDPRTVSATLGVRF